MTMTTSARRWAPCFSGAASIPAPAAGHERMATQCGKRIGEMIWEARRSVTSAPEAFENEIY
jgi:dihydroxy-acid dehydratase